jgi:hypothetical protein
MFHNTTHETGETRATYRQSAMKQEEAVLALFRARRLPMSPSQVWRHYGADLTPLTSIRRAISNLTRDGLLEKMEVKVEGIYSHPEHLWRLGDGQ